MQFSEYLAHEWVPALGCTEPASIALAASTAAQQLEGTIERIALIVDPRIYKNCYAVGIPHSGHKTGILWAAAIGAQLPNPDAGLELFRDTTAEIVARAERLVDAGAIDVTVDTEHDELFIDCRITATEGTGRCVIEREHTGITLVERDGEVVQQRSAERAEGRHDFRAETAALSLDEMIALARSIGQEDRARLREGIAMNRAIAEHGLTLFPKPFLELTTRDTTSRASALVCGGVYARMWGEELPVMSLAGSGNKGITASVPLAVRGEIENVDSARVEEALALACLVTSATTHHLGTLSAVCGCSNAAGIGLAAGLVLMGGGDDRAIELAIHNMVGNVTGMICDGAKIGCALKTMTAVDAALRAATLALGGIGIPPCDGIVGHEGSASLANMGRIATRGMLSTDAEILAIMNEKLKRKEDDA